MRGVGRAQHSAWNGEHGDGHPHHQGRGVLAATCLLDARRQRQHVRGHDLVAGDQRGHWDVGDDLQWAVTGYSLVGAAVIVTSGSLGDVFGRKRIFLGGLLLFVASCVLIALSTNGGAVIAGRMIQGAAGSTILACGLSLLSGREHVAGPAARGLAVGCGCGVGAAAGPLVGGVLVDLTGWQGLFWIDAVVAAVCIVITVER